MFLHHASNRKSHYIIKIASYAFDADHTDPFLNGIGAGFVEGFLGVDVPLDFLVRKVFEKHFGLNGFGEFSMFCLAQYRIAGEDLMGLSAELS
jgi:hypothetical protein